MSAKRPGRIQPDPAAETRRREQQRATDNSAAHNASRDPGQIRDADPNGASDRDDPADVGAGHHRADRPGHLRQAAEAVRLQPEGTADAEETHEGTEEEKARGQARHRCARLARTTHAGSAEATGPESLPDWDTRRARVAACIEFSIADLPADAQRRRRLQERAAEAASVWFTYCTVLQDTHAIYGRAPCTAINAPRYTRAGSLRGPGWSY